MRAAWHWRSTKHRGRGTSRGTTPRKSFCFGVWVVGRAGLEPATLSLKGLSLFVLPAFFQISEIYCNQNIVLGLLPLGRPASYLIMPGVLSKFRPTPNRCGTTVAPGFTPWHQRGIYAQSVPFQQRPDQGDFGSA